jgi:putative ABC transport system permease protein
MTFVEFKETIVIAIDAMKGNKLRSLLASLGVVIGISTVILMGWVLTGLQTAMDETFRMIGVDILYIDKWDWAGGKNWKLVRQRKDITFEQADLMMERLTNAELIFPTARTWGGNIKYENNVFNGITIIGTTSEHGLTSAGETIEGRYFTPFEESIHSKVVVLGHKVYTTIFPDGNALNQTIKINGHKFFVIGVIRKQGTMFFDFIDNQVFIPVGSFVGVYGKHNRSISIGIKAGSEEMLDEVREEARGIMRSIRNVDPNAEDDFSINETKAFESQVATLKLYVWGIGIGMTVLSFIVGIIGIMNIMFVSVTERTKEIGIRMAIGAKRRSILFQFIVESSTLCFIGAIISLIICSGITFAVATILPQFLEEAGFLTPYLPFQLLIIASIVSILVGVLSGIIPAIRASKLNPIDALRFE